MNKILILFILIELLSGCATRYPLAPSTLPSSTIHTDILLPGDQIRLVVFGEDNLSGPYILDNKGVITLPLVGSVILAGDTMQQAADRIKQALQQGYLRNPHVAISFEHPHDVYILGEVQKPGNYAYAPNLTVVQAVAKAGGYTYRADHDDILLRRTVPGLRSTVTSKLQANEDTPLLPGDSITVQERFF